jgi:excisionase family DNA binding protein
VLDEYPERKHFSIGEAAAIAQISRDIMYRAVKNGAVRTWRPYANADQRIYREDLEAWMRDCRSNDVHVS